MQRACKTRPACAACVKQHARRRSSSQPNHCIVRHRDCTIAAFEIVEIFARKRANAAANCVRFRHPIVFAAHAGRFFLMRCAPKLHRPCCTLARFLAKFCAISMPMARFLGARRDADYAKSCAGIARFARHALAKECASFVRSPRQIRRNLQPIWGVVVANFAQGRHRTRVFSAWMRHRFDQVLHRHLAAFLVRAG